MPDSYSVEAILTATDKNYTSTMNAATKSLDGISDSSNSALSSIKNIAAGLGVFKLLSASASLLTTSISGAVDRYDTLNRYPKVLEQLGYSTDQAESSTQKLSDGVQGLPTKLDDVVSTSQRLVLLTDNLELATDTTLALNNAFIASNASTSDAVRGTEQYIQMLSKGSVDLQSWRTLQETMPYALKETANAFGYAGSSATNDFYSALQSGEITFDDFNTKLIELSNETGGFAEVAQTASGGIGTAWTNMQTHIVQGVTAIIESLDNGLSQTRFGSIQNIIDNFGNAFKAVLKGVAVVIEPIAANIDLVAAAAVGLAAAFAVPKVMQAWCSSMDRINEVTSFAEQTNTKLSVSLGKSDTSALRLATSVEALAAKEAEDEAATANNHASKLKLIETEKNLAEQIAKEAVETSKSTEQKKLEEAAVKAEQEAKTAATKASNAATIAAKENATAAQKNTAEKKNAILASKKEEAALAKEAAQRNKSAETIRLEAEAERASKAAKEAKTVADKASAAATTATEKAALAAAAAQNQQNTSLTLGQAAIGMLTGKVGLHTVATTIATAATHMFSNALKALPMMAVMGAVTALVSWITTLGDETNKATEAIDEINESFEENKSKAGENAYAASILVDELSELESQGLKTTAQQNRYKAIVEQLNELMPELNLEIDEQTGLLKDNVDAIKAQIAALEESYIEQAYLEQATNLYKAKGKEVIKLRSAQSGLTENEKKQTEIVKKLSELTGESTEYIEEQAAAIGGNAEALAGFIAEGQLGDEVIIGLIEQLSTLTVENENLGVTIGESEEAIGSFDEQIAESKDGLNAYSEETEGTSETVQASFDTIAEAYDSLNEAQTTAIDGILSAYETMTASLSDLTSKIKEDDKTTWATIQENQADTIAKTKEFSELYAQLIEAGVSESYLDAIGATGPEAIPLLQSMLSEGTDTVLASQSEWENAYGEIGDTALSAFELDDTTRSAIEEYISGETGIVGSLKDAVENADLTAVGLGLSDGVVEGIESVDFGESSAAILADIASGIISNPREVAKASRELGISIESNVTDNIDSVAIGSDIPSGMAGGINKNAGEVAKAARELGTSSEEATRNALKSNSPSKVYIGIGEDVDAGFTKGISNDQNKVVKSLKNVTKELESAAQLYDSMFSAGTNAMAGMNAGLNAGASGVYATATTIANNVANKISSALQIHSPSRVLKSLGMYAMGGFGAGLEKMQSYIGKIVDETSAMVTGNLNSALDAGNISGSYSTATTVNLNNNDVWLERIYHALEAGKTIVMDNGAFVGATYSTYDAVGGQKVAYNTRWGR